MDTISGQDKQDGMGKFKPGRVGGKNSYYRSGTTPVGSHVMKEIFAILAENRDKAAYRDKKVGAITQERREKGIIGFFSDLFFLGYKLESVHSLKQKHLKSVFNFLEEQGQSPATIQNKISVIRVFCEWIGKNGMVVKSTDYVKDDRSTRRSMVVKEDKSWEGKGVDLVSTLAAITAKDPNVGISLELCWAFGLRVKEAVMLRPAVSHEGDSIWIREGTKGDRPRVIPIENPIQLDVLNRAKLLVDKKTGMLGVRGKSVEQKERRLYYVMSLSGLTLAEKEVSAHGLRHQYMQESFLRLTGIPAPVKGGDISLLSHDDLHLATQKLVERAGHTRPTIGASYYGSRRKKKTVPTAPIKE